MGCSAQQAACHVRPFVQARTVSWVSCVSGVECLVAERYPGSRDTRLRREASSVSRGDRAPRAVSRVVGQDERHAVARRRSRQVLSCWQQSGRRAYALPGALPPSRGGGVCRRGAYRQREAPQLAAREAAMGDRGRMRGPVVPVQS